MFCVYICVFVCVCMCKHNYGLGGAARPLKLYN